MLQPGETTAVTAIVPEALGPQSLAWKHAGDNLRLLYGGPDRAPKAGQDLFALPHFQSKQPEQHGRIDLAA